MKTRKEYMDNLAKYGTAESTANHRAYYGQFVTAGVKAVVLARFGRDRLMACRDEHLNDIPLAKWDEFWMRRDNLGGMFIQPPFGVVAMLNEAGEGFSAATGVCILKEAAKQIIAEGSK
jgi:hypothetical protein